MVCKVVIVVLACLAVSTYAGIAPLAAVPFASSYTAHAINHAIAAPVAVPAAVHAAPLALPAVHAAPLALPAVHAASLAAYPAAYSYLA